MSLQYHPEAQFITGASKLHLSPVGQQSLCNYASLLVEAKSNNRVSSVWLYSIKILLTKVTIRPDLALKLFD